MRVKPAHGLMVRDPHSKLPLPADGAEVPDDSFWQRRIRSGDVVLIETPSAPAGLADRMVRSSHVKEG